MKDEEEATSLTIRGIPARVLKTLTARAEARRLSLNAYVLELLAQAADEPVELIREPN